MSRQSIGVANENATLDERVVTLATGTTKIEPHKHANRVLLVATATSLHTLNLPVATGSGDKYTIMTTVARGASGSIVINATHGGTSNVMVGVIFQATSTATYVKNASTTNDIITLNGTTQGWVNAGDKIELLDGKANTWYVNGFVTTSGAEATPFSG